jgi:hypothetical protein
MAQAIARQEGFFSPGSLSQRNNNPGNLRIWGQQPIVRGYAQFSDPESGWRALRRQVQLNIARGLTVEQFFAGKPGVYAGYAPAKDGNDPATYAANVARWTGVPQGTPLNQIEGDGSSENPTEPAEAVEFAPVLENPTAPGEEGGGLLWPLLAAGAVVLAAVFSPDA